MGIVIIGMAVAGVGVKPLRKNAVADGMNRKALGEIGNLPTVRGIDVKPNRPITRFITQFFYLCYLRIDFCYFLTNVLW